MYKAFKSTYIWGKPQKQICGEMPIRLLLVEILGKLNFEWLTISKIGMILNKKAWAKNFNTQVGAKWGPAEWKNTAIMTRQARTTFGWVTWAWTMLPAWYRQVEREQKIRTAKNYRFWRKFVFGRSVGQCTVRAITWENDQTVTPDVISQHDQSNDQVRSRVIN